METEKITPEMVGAAKLLQQIEDGPDIPGPDKAEPERIEWTHEWLIQHLSNGL